MRIAILSNDLQSFIIQLAEGLQRLFRKLNVDSEVFYDGYDLLQSDDYFNKYWSKLNKFDVVIAVVNIPTAFRRDCFVNLEKLRQLIPVDPIIYYANYQLPTRGPWAEWLKDGNPEKGVRSNNNWGLERYDWYLSSSIVSEFPLPQYDWPFSVIGVNLDDGTLYPEQKEFIALVDFERTGFEAEREVQIRALQATNTKFIELKGQYSVAAIRKIYRQCSIYFIAFRESFGLPICELQACGSYIFTPYAHWVPSHWIKPDLSVPGPGEISPNFIVYHNDLETLKNKIIQIKKSFDAKQVRQRFLKYHPQLFYGDLKELQRFVNLLQTKQITSQSHLKYPNISEVVRLIGN